MIEQNPSNLFFSSWFFIFFNFLFFSIKFFSKTQKFKKVFLKNQKKAMSFISQTVAGILRRSANEKSSFCCHKHQCNQDNNCSRPHFLSCDEKSESIISLGSVKNIDVPNSDWYIDEEWVFTFCIHFFFVVNCGNINILSWSVLMDKENLNKTYFDKENKFLTFLFFSLQTQRIFRMYVVSG